MDITSSLTPPTWRLLGLSVAVGYAGLGTAAILSPAYASRVFGLKLSQPTKPASDSKYETSFNSNDVLNRSFALLGVRDLSLATALFWFDYEKKPREMGIVITSGMILCAYDVFECWRNNGTRDGLTLALGAGLWGVIGLGLLGLRSF